MISNILMKRIILILLLLFTSIVLLQANTDSTYLSKEINKLHETIKLQNRLSKNTIDSLQRELLYYMVKEDYYAASLSWQTGVFTVVVSILFLIFAGISWSSMRLKIKNTEEKIYDRLEKYNSDFDSKILEMEEKYNEEKEKAVETKEGFFVLSFLMTNEKALELHKKGKYLMAIEFYFQTLVSLQNIIELDKENHMYKDQFIENIQKVNMILSDLTNRVKIEEDVLSEYKKKLNAFSKIEYDEIKDLLAETRVYLKAAREFENMPV